MTSPHRLVVIGNGIRAGRTRGLSVVSSATSPVRESQSSTV